MARSRGAHERFGDRDQAPEEGRSAPNLEKDAANDGLFEIDDAADRVAAARAAAPSALVLNAKRAEACWPGSCSNCGTLDLSALRSPTPS